MPRRLLALLVVAVVAASGGSSGDDESSVPDATAGPPSTAPTQPVDSTGPVATPDDTLAELDWIGTTSEAFVLVDVRSADAYASGHIEGP